MHKKPSEMTFRYYPPCEDNDVAFCGTRADWTQYAEDQRGEIFCDLCDEPHAAEDYIEVEEPTPDPIGAFCECAARRLLEAAAPSTTSPTTALLRAAVALSEAGARVVEVFAPVGQERQEIDFCVGDQMVALILWGPSADPGAVRILPAGRTVEARYTDADTLAGALREVIEGDRRGL